MYETQPPSEVVTPRWYTIEQVAIMLNYGLTKTKYLVHSGQIRSIKDGEIGASCPNGSMSTFASGSRNSRREQTPEWRVLYIRVPQRLGSLRLG